MNEPLHPSTLSEILDRTAQIYRSRFLVFLGISIIPTAAVLIPACAGFLFFMWWGSSGINSVSTATAGILALVFFASIALVAVPFWLVVTSLAAAAMNHAVARSYRNETITIRDAYKSAWPHGWRFIGLYVLQALLIWGVPIAVWLVLLGLTAAAAALMRSAATSIAALFGIIAFLIFAAMVVYGFWMVLRLSLAFPACVVEQMGAVAALKRSARLSKGTRGRIFLLYLLAAALGWIVSIGITIPLSIIVALLPGAGNPQSAQTSGMVMLFIIYGSGFAVQAIIKPIYGIALMLFYYDQRIRLEGFDIEWLMQRAGLVPAPGSDSEPPHAPAPAG